MSESKTKLLLKYQDSLYTPIVIVHVAPDNIPREVTDQFQAAFVVRKLPVEENENTVLIVDANEFAKHFGEKVIDVTDYSHEVTTKEFAHSFDESS